MIFLQTFFRLFLYASGIIGGAVSRSEDSREYSSGTVLRLREALGFCTFKFSIESSLANDMRTSLDSIGQQMSDIVPIERNHEMFGDLLLLRSMYR